MKIYNPAITLAKLQAYDGTDWVNASSDSSGRLNVNVVSSASSSDVVTASGSIASGDNTAGFTVSLDTEGKKLVHWHVVLGGAGDAKVQVSDDNSTWYDTANSTSLSGAGEWDDWDFIGFRYVRVNVPTTGIDVTIKISAKP